MGMKSVVEKAFAISVVGAAAWAAGYAVHYGGESLLSHLEAEKVTNAALWALAKGCEGGGDYLAKGGWFVATLIPSLAYKVGAEIQPHVTPPVVEKIFKIAISPVFSVVSGIAHNWVVQPIINHGPGMVASFGKDLCLPAAVAIGGVARWTFGTALPEVLNFTVFSIFVPTVTTVGSAFFHVTAGICGLGFGVLSWVGDTGSSCIEYARNLTAGEVANATANVADKVANATTIVTS